MITAALVLLIGCLYGLAPTIAGGIDPTATAADLARAMGPAIAGFAALSIFPSARHIRYVNVVVGLALIVSPLAVLWWDPTALVIQAIVGFLVAGLTLLPRDRDRIITGGGWRYVFRSPSNIDRIETAAEL